MLSAETGADDQLAWNDMVDRHAGLVWTVARALGLDADEATAVNRVIWLRLAQRFGSARQPERLGAWLATTAKQESLRVRGLRDRQVQLAGEHDHEELHGEPAAPDTSLLIADQSAALRQAFQSLSWRCQLLLRLLIAEPPLSHAEIAAVLEIPADSVDPTRGRCLQCLRRALGAGDAS